MTRPTAADFADGAAVAFDDQDGGVRVPTNAPTTLHARTRYTRATTIDLTGRVAPGERVTFTASAGNAWRTVVKGGVRTPVDKAPATDAELRQLRWRVHCGGVLLADQRPGETSNAVTLTLPARLAGETVLVGGYNEEPLVGIFLPWWVEDARVRGGKRDGRGTKLEDVEQLARIMGFATAAVADQNRAHVRDAFRPLVDGFEAAGMDTLEQVHFLAQVAHETGGLTLLKEVRSDASAGQKYAQSNGNKGPLDGAAFKGRGVLQTTGYSGYRSYFADVEHAPDLSRPTLRQRAPELEAMPDAVEAGLHFWSTKNCGERARLDDALGVSIRVNGWNKPSYLPNNYQDRLAALQRAKRELGIAR